MKLNNLKVNSFITRLNNTNINTIKGGETNKCLPPSFWCSAPNPCPTPVVGTKTIGG